MNWYLGHLSNLIVRVVTLDKMYICDKCGNIHRRDGTEIRLEDIPGVKLHNKLFYKSVGRKCFKNLMDNVHKLLDNDISVSVATEHAEYTPSKKLDSANGNCFVVSYLKFNEATNMWENDDCKVHDDLDTIIEHMYQSGEHNKNIFPIYQDIRNLPADYQEIPRNVNRCPKFYITRDTVDGNPLIILLVQYVTGNRKGETIVPVAIYRGSMRFEVFI